MRQIDNILFQYKDLKYRDLTIKTVPNIDRDSIIGIPIPTLRRIAKNIREESYIETFLNTLPHRYHEEYLLHVFILIYKYEDINILLNKLDVFLNYANNWAITDSICGDIFKKNKEITLIKIKEWLNSNYEYKVRLALVLLLKYYLDDDSFDKKIFNDINKIKIDTYYVNMAISWYYSYALMKQYKTTIKLFENKKLKIWIHNKSISKAIDSYQISKEKKEYLKSLRIK